MALPFALCAQSAPVAQTQATAPPAIASSATATVEDQTLGISFDVVSIRPVEEKHNGHVTNPPDGDGITIENYTLYDILVWNFRLGYSWRRDQFQGIPKGFYTDNYDIHAKVADSDVATWRKLNDGARRLVFRKVLADRFKFSSHFMDVEKPVYNLVIAGGGLKIQEAKPGEVSPYHFHAPGDPNTPYAGTGITTRQTPDGWITAFQQTHMSSFAKSFLSDRVGRQVIDKTGLTGAYNFALNFAYDPLPVTNPDDLSASDPGGPSIFTAVEKQLGLKLVPAKGPVSVLVIDHIEKPSEN